MLFNRFNEWISDVFSWDFFLIVKSYSYIQIMSQ